MAEFDKGSAPPPLPAPMLTCGQIVPQTGLPTWLQAILGTLATGPVLFFGSLFIVMFIGELATSVSANAQNAVFFGVGGSFAIATLVGSLLLARKCRRSTRYKGWAIGIYIGLFLNLLAWGAIALFIAIMVIGSKH